MTPVVVGLFVPFLAVRAWQLGDPVLAVCAAALFVHDLLRSQPGRRRPAAGVADADADTDCPSSPTTSDSEAAPDDTAADALAPRATCHRRNVPPPTPANDKDP